MQGEIDCGNSEVFAAKHQEIMSAHHGLPKLKALFWANWFALGNVLLLIGGDDSVEIGINPRAFIKLNQTPLPQSSEYHRSQNP
jgi:hypothetical protein